MALNRTVMMGDGVLRRIHNVFRITHISNESTHIEVASRVKDPTEPSPWFQTITVPLDDTITFEAAYGIIADRPEFAAYDSVDETINAELLEQVEDLTGQLQDANDAAQAAESSLGSVLSVLTDEQALTVPTAFPQWKVGVLYAIGTRVQYNSNLYKCVQAHTSQWGWDPRTTPSLWASVATPSEDGTPPEWVQPTGAQDAYNTGDLVTYDSKTWRCTSDANVYAPGVFGWEEVQQ